MIPLEQLETDLTQLGGIVADNLERLATTYKPGTKWFTAEYYPLRVSDGYGDTFLYRYLRVRLLPRTVFLPPSRKLNLAVEPFDPLPDLLYRDRRGYHYIPARYYNLALSILHELDRRQEAYEPMPRTY